MASGANGAWVRGGFRNTLPSVVAGVQYLEEMSRQGHVMLQASGGAIKTVGQAPPCRQGSSPSCWSNGVGQVSGVRNDGQTP